MVVNQEVQPHEDNENLTNNSSCSLCSCSKQDLNKNDDCAPYSVNACEKECDDGVKEHEEMNSVDIDARKSTALELVPIVIE